MEGKNKQGFVRKFVSSLAGMFGRKIAPVGHAIEHLAKTTPIEKKAVPKKPGWSRRRTGWHNARGHNLTTFGVRMLQLQGCDVGKIWPDFR